MLRSLRVLALCSMFEVTKGPASLHQVLEACPSLRVLCLGGSAPFDAAPAQPDQLLAALHASSLRVLEATFLPKLQRWLADAPAGALDLQVWDMLRPSTAMSPRPAGVTPTGALGRSLATVRSAHSIACCGRRGWVGAVSGGKVPRLFAAHAAALRLPAQQRGRCGMAAARGG